MVSKHKAWRNLQNVEAYKHTFDQTVAYAMKLCKMADTDLLLRVGNVVSVDEPGVHQYGNAQDEHFYHNRRRLIHAVRRGLQTKPMGVVRQALLMLNDHWSWYEFPTLEQRIVFRRFREAVETLDAFETGAISAIQIR